VLLAVPGQLPITPAPGRTVRESLVGVTVADLQAMVAAAHAAGRSRRRGREP
jgi:hypothetical protein